MISFLSLRSIKKVMILFSFLSLVSLLLYFLSRHHHRKYESYVRKCRWERNPRQLNQTVEVCEETTES